MNEVVLISYVVAAILFIFGIKMLGSASTARKGNLLSSVGMLIAIVATLTEANLDYQWIAVGIIIGALIGVVAAKRVEMTGMPELVALLNGFGGAASFLVGWAQYTAVYNNQEVNISYFEASVIFIAIFIGAITSSGSLIAWGKLSGKMGGSPITFSGQKVLNLVFIVGTFGLGVAFTILSTGASGPNLVRSGRASGDLTSTHKALERLTGPRDAP